MAELIFAALFLPLLCKIRSALDAPVERLTDQPQPTE
jgi:hypothetical protein